MEITSLIKDSIRIKGKKITFVIHSEKKIPGDVALVLSNNKASSSVNVDGSQLVPQGTGEYEVAGTKFTCYTYGNEYAYDMVVDGVRVLLGMPGVLQKIKDKISERDIVIVDTSSMLSDSVITQLGPRVVVLYGEKSEEVAKSIGKNITAEQIVKKYQTTAEKLPAELETVVLG